MNDHFIIRRTEIEDFEKLFSLITALARYEQLDPPDDDAKVRLFEHGFGEQPKYESWMLELDGQAVGYAILFETYSSFLAKPTLYLEDLFILPEHRGNGFGRKALKKLIAEAKERDCGRIEWCCLDWNEVGLKFYQKIGARPLSEWIYFRLIPGEETRQPEE